MNVLKKIKTKIFQFSSYLNSICFSPVKELDKISFNKKIYFYSLVWGESFNSYFNFTLPSLLHKSNYTELVKNNFELFFIVYTKDSEDLIRIKYKDIISKYKYINFEIVEINSQNRKEPRKIASIAIINMFARCVKEKALFFMAPPDMIFGASSIYNCVISSFDKKKNFAAAHPRVTPKILNCIDTPSSGGIPNSKLVSLAMRNQHQTFKFADFSLELNTTYTGISYSKINESLYSVISKLPTVFLVFPLKEDYDYFVKVDDFNMWDRGWLEKILKQDRIIVSGSSELFFTVELTDEAIKTKLRSGSTKKRISDKIFHCRVLGIFSSVWHSS